VAALKARFPESPVFLSTTTLTGHAVAGRAIPTPLASSTRLSTGRVRAPRASRASTPKLLVIMETEIWPNLIHEARRHGARVAIANGRISERSLRATAACAASSAACSRRSTFSPCRATSMPAASVRWAPPPPRVHALGNLKFDAPAGRAPRRPWRS